MKDGEQCGKSVSVFEDWPIIGYSAPCYATKFRAYFYRRESGSWKYNKVIQASDGGDVDQFGSSV